MMWKRIACVALTALVFVSIFGTGVTAQENLILNPGFEEPLDEQVWGQYVWEVNQEITRFDIDDTVAHSGGKSARIENTAENDARYKQVIAVEPDSYYRLSGWVLTEGVGRAVKGANISVEGIYDTSADVKGTSDGWQYLELYGLTGAQQEALTVTAALGGYSNVNTGKAWFDDIEVERVDMLPEGASAVKFFMESEEAAAQETQVEPVEPIHALYIYLAFFLALTFVLFQKIGKIQFKLTDRNVGRSLIFVLAGSVLLKLLFSTASQGFSSDIGCFKSWALNAAQNLTGFYSGDFFADYPPLYILVLFIVGKVTEVLGLGYDSEGFLMLIKVPPIICETVTAYLIYKFTLNYKSKEWAVFAAALYAFNPVVFIDSTIWGQVDGVFALLLVLSFIGAWNGAWNRSAVYMVLGILLKPQGLIFLPVLFFQMLKGQRVAAAVMTVLKAALAAFTAMVLVVLPFSFGQSPFWIVDLYRSTTGQYAYATLNAYNLFAAMGANWKSDSTSFLFLNYSVWGTLFIAVTVLFIGWVFMRSKRRDILFLMSSVMIIAVFNLSARMHERYMFPAIALLLLSYLTLEDRRLWHLFVGFTVTNFINIEMVLARMILHGDVVIPAQSWGIRIVSLLNVFLFIYLIKTTLDICLKNNILEFSGKWQSFFTAKGESRPREYHLTRNDFLIIGVMCAAYLALSLIRLGDFTAPETEWLPTTAGESFVLAFDAPVAVGRISYFCARGEGWHATGVYNVQYDDGSGRYIPLGNLDKNDVFKWKTLDVSVETTSLRFVVETPGGSINEIGIFAPDKTTLLRGHIVEKTGLIGPVENLFDEQAVAVYTPSYLNGTYFDEIYFARTAYEHLNGIDMYETTHPPLGKLFIAIGIELFGMNPFGWRIVGNLFGVAMIGVMYAFGKRFFGSSFFAFCSAFLLMVDFMHFTQTRIATIDGYVTFFIILMYLFMYKYFMNKSYEVSFLKSLIPLLFSGICFGLAAASKWIGLYGGAGLAVIFFLSRWLEYREYKHTLKTHSNFDRKRLQSFFRTRILGTMLACVVFFVLIPLAIYAASYIPILSLAGSGTLMERFIGTQQSMYNYHSTLVATHPFASSWWQWPILYKPVWYYSGTDLAQGMASTIVALGNPIIWWTGMFAIVSAFLIGVANKDKRLIVLFVAMGFQYLPWVMVTRITFMYHFFSTVPFMIICIVYTFEFFLEKYNKPKSYMLLYLAVAALLFAVFYPALSGMMVSAEHIDKLKWLDSWYF